jgi:hypothetical protein
LAEWIIVIHPIDHACGQALLAHSLRFPTKKEKVGR